MTRPNTQRPGASSRCLTASKYGLAASAICLALLAVTSAWAQVGGERRVGPAAGFAAVDDDPVLALSAQFTKPTEGRSAHLFITATIKSGWHIYSITQAPGGPVPTRIKVAPSRQYEVGGFRSHPAPESKKERAFGDLTVESHSGEVVWSASIRFAASVDISTLKIQGTVNAQPCTSSSCLPPRDFPFTAGVGPGVSVPLDGPTASSVAASESAAESQGLQIADSDTLQDISTPMAMLLGFVGGLILNLMPCVLPVIGLKIFSFMEQAGQSRRQGLILNLWYSSGLVAVFLVLATLTVLLGLGWGELFTYKGFTITLAAVVFAMGLSFLGVWEIPIPGFIGRGKASEWAGKEGALGAFAKGVVTTLLATPCSAPLLASAVAWSAKQPPLVTYAVFTSMGLGMASPYLLIGAFPELIRFLPKPGAWMETFRQLMGFVLLATVVFVLTFIQPAYLVPTVALLFGIWFACWWIGRTPLTADFQTQLLAWLIGAVITAVVWLAAFGGLFAKTELPWRPFTRQAFQELVDSGQTVMVDFTADWCLTCKTLETFVLNTAPVRRAVEANGVVPMKADWTHGDQEVTDMLEKLGTKQVPVLAIFPAGHPNRPIRLLGGYRTQTLLDALSKAGPSKTPSL